MPDSFHPQCIHACQKFARTGHACAGSCELAPFVPAEQLVLRPELAPEPPAVVVERAKKRINVRAKGQRGEREVVGILQEIVDRIRLKYRMQPMVIQRNALQSHLGGADLHGLEGFAFEVKFCETEVINQWWKQAVNQANKLSATTNREHVPVLFYRATRQPWFVKFRAYVQTPRDTTAREMDMECDLADFLEWFEDSYEEMMVEETQLLK